MFSTMLECVNLFPSSVSDFSPHGYQVIGSVARSSYLKVPKISTNFKHYIRRFCDVRCEVISDHQGPLKLKRVLF